MKKLVVGLFTVLSSNCGPAEGGPNSGCFGPPELIAEPESLFFEVGLGDASTALELRNAQECSELRINSFRLVELMVQEPGDTEFIPVGEWPSSGVLTRPLVLEIAYRPRDDEADEAYVELYTNDPRFEDGIARIPILAE